MIKKKKNNKYTINQADKIYHLELDRPNNALKLTWPSAWCLRWYVLRWRSKYNEASCAQSAKQLSAVRWAFTTVYARGE